MNFYADNSESDIADFLENGFEDQCYRIDFSISPEDKCIIYEKCVDSDDKYIAPYRKIATPPDCGESLRDEIADIFENGIDGMGLPGSRRHLCVDLACLIWDENEQCWLCVHTDGGWWSPAQDLTPITPKQPQQSVSFSPWG